MRLKLVGIILLAISVLLGIAAVLYRVLAHVRACEAEYRYLISRSGRLPGSRRKKEISAGPDSSASEGTKTAALTPWDDAETAVLTPWADAKTAALTPWADAKTAVLSSWADFATEEMDAEASAAETGYEKTEEMADMQYAVTAIMEE